MEDPSEGDDPSVPKGMELRFDKGSSRQNATITGMPHPRDLSMGALCEHPLTTGHQYLWSFAWHPTEAQLANDDILYWFQNYAIPNDGGPQGEAETGEGYLEFTID